MRNLATSMIGNWQGTKQLFPSLTLEAEHCCPSSLSIQPIVNHHFLQLVDHWAYRDQAQRSIILIGAGLNEREVTATWNDTWHHAADIMSCSGHQSDTWEIDLHSTGTNDEDSCWTWRIMIKIIDINQLEIYIHNTGLQGTESLVAYAKYRRQQP